MIKYNFVVALAVATATTTASGRAGDVQLEFEVTKQFTPKKLAANEVRLPAEAVAKPTEQKTQLQVVLATNEVVTESEGIRTIYDFKGRRILQLTPNTRSYADLSLFSVVGFRVIEFQNRRSLAGLLKGVDLKDEPMPIPLSEHLFSLADPETKATVDRKAENGTVAYSWKSRPLLSWSEKIVPMPAHQRSRFATFVRYVYGGRPELLSAMQKLDGIPERLVITMHDVPGTTTTTLALKSSNTLDGPAFALAGLQKSAPVQDPKLASLLEKAQIDGPADHTRRSEAIAVRAKNALQEKRGLDVFLALTEFSIQNGKPLSGLDKDQVGALVKTDPNLRDLLSSLKPPANEKAAVEATETLHRLAAHAEESGRHVLKLFEANNLSAAGDVQAAEKLFVDALATNPSLTGAWKDLGDLHFRRFDMKGAWICWDLARTISPEHEMLKPVNDFESRLMKDHPEYFAPLAVPTP